MTRLNDLDRALVTWFDAEAAAPAPADLLECVTDETARRRPRPTVVARAHQFDVRRLGVPALDAAVGPLPVSLWIVLLALGLVASGLLIAGARLILFPDGNLHLAGIVEPVGSMHAQVAYPTAVALADGRLLVGGTVINGQEYSPHFEVFDPGTGRFTPVATAVAGWAEVRSLVRLADSSVLILLHERIRPGPGGVRPVWVVLDPSSGATRQAAGIPSDADNGDAKLLPDGRVRLGTVAWDPTTGSATPIAGLGGPPSLPPSVYGGTDAIVLADGRTLVLTTGDDLTVRAVLHDPTTGRSATIPTPLIAVPRSAGIQMPDGRVLWLGANQVVFDPRAETFRDLNVAGSFSFVGWLRDGRALLARTDQTSLFSGTPAAIRPWTFDPATGALQPLATASDPSTSGSFFILADGRVLMLELASDERGPSGSGDTRAWVLH